MKLRDTGFAILPPKLKQLNFSVALVRCCCFLTRISTVTVLPGCVTTLSGIGEVVKLRGGLVVVA